MARLTGSRAFERFTGPQIRKLHETDPAAYARGGDRATITDAQIVLHRLNRTEYANAIRDLLAVDIDPAKFLPPDDSSRGFDNIAGSLTISPTLLEAYVSAATKIARMAVGFWKTPTEALYIVRTDSSQVYQLDGQPFGTRGGVAVEHIFPADGDYTFTVILDYNNALSSSLWGTEIVI